MAAHTHFASHRLIQALGLLAFVAGIWLAPSTSSAGTSTVVVNATCNIFGAGHTVAPDPAGGGGGELPTYIVLPADHGASLQFLSIEGTVGCCGSLTGSESGGPDGAPREAGTHISSYNGVSGISHDTRAMFLVGVFLTDAEPSDPAPAVLSFTGGGTPETLTPEVGQTFFIGDGRSDGGALQSFSIPAGATRLALGFADGGAFVGAPGFYSDDVGSLTATVSIADEVNALVNATSNIFGAGHTVAPDPAGGGGGELPTYIPLPVDRGSSIQFLHVEGTVGCCSSLTGSESGGPDGAARETGTNISSYNGISGISHDSRAMFLVGVFLTDAEPSDPAPAVLSFTGGGEFSVLSPELSQTFFIGDGNRDSGRLQTFTIPAGATRLALGFADAAAFQGAPGSYQDDVGSVSAVVLINNASVTGVPGAVTPSSTATLHLAITPNPTRGGVRFLVASARPVTGVALHVYDLAGRRLRTLNIGDIVSNQREVAWDGHAESGTPLAGGVYFCRVECAQGISSERQVVVLH